MNCKLRSQSDMLSFFRFGGIRTTGTFTCGRVHLPPQSPSVKMTICMHADSIPRILPVMDCVCHQTKLAKQVYNVLVYVLRFVHPILYPASNPAPSQTRTNDDWNAQGARLECSKKAIRNHVREDRVYIYWVSYIFLEGFQ